MRILSGFVGILSVSALLGGCVPVKRIPAEYCAAVDAHGTSQDAKLAATFDRFAIKEGLSIDRSNPAARDYESADKLIDISVSFGMGDHGAIVALFRLAHAAESTLLGKLSQFVDTEVARDYRVTPCNEIKGFRNPEMFK